MWKVERAESRNVMSYKLEFLIACNADLEGKLYNQVFSFLRYYTIISPLEFSLVTHSGFIVAKCSQESPVSYMEQGRNSYIKQGRRNTM